jgi:hypothetical protein
MTLTPLTNFVQNTIGVFIPLFLERRLHDAVFIGDQCGIGVQALANNLPPLGVHYSFFTPPNLPLRDDFPSIEHLVLCQTFEL